jgi:glucose-6-phosphate dehydrogenase assembly protein OpcA
VVLWCRGPSAFNLRAFDNLFPLADKLIFDSATVPGGAAALGFLRGLRAHGYRVADLPWTRLTGWREIVAHLFDDQALLPEDVSWARVGYGGSIPSSDALYIGAWIGHALPSARVSFEESRDGSGPGLCSIALGGSKGELLLRRVPAKESRTAEPEAAGKATGAERCSGPGRSGSCLEVSGCGRHYRSLLPPADEESLMREELKIIGPDPVYESVLG